jgi:hypothetical protein
MKLLRTYTRLRVIEGKVCFYSTVKEIRQGVGDFTEFNDLCALALKDIEMNGGTGVVYTHKGRTVQLDIAEKG